MNVYQLIFIITFGNLNAPAISLCHSPTEVHGFSQSYTSVLDYFMNMDYTSECQLHTFSNTFDSSTVINFMAENNLSTDNNCGSDLAFIHKHMNQAWALKFVDSFGKTPSGVSIGAINWFGSFGLCTLLNTTSNSPIETQYCTAYVNHIFEHLPLNIGLCLPKACTDKDLKSIMEKLIKYIKIPTKTNFSNAEVSNSSYCHRPKSLNENAGSYVMICLITFIVILILIGTTIDYYIYCKPRVYFNISTNIHLNTREDDQPLIVEEVGRVSPVRYLDDSTNMRHYKKVDCNGGTALRVILSFSLKKNISQLLNTRGSESTLECIHGVRFLSMCWIILMHVYGSSGKFSNNSKEFFSKEYQKHSFDIVVGGTFAVDSFFLISGILTAYLFQSTIHRYPEKLKSFRFWMLFYVHRFWRLTPPYMLFLGTYVTLVPYISEGPIWPNFQGSADPHCTTDWWKNLLYINNLFGPLNKTCMAHSWYLANDMQFYVISPIFLIVMHNNILAGILINASVILLSMLTTFFVSFEGNFSIMSRALDPSIYVRPWIRISPYMVGLMYGYFLHRHKCRHQISRIVNVLVWICSFGLTSFFIFSFHNFLINNKYSRINPDEGAIINATCRVVWSACLGWLIYACCNKYGGVINRILSWKALVPLSRLSYCAYLVHPIVMYVCLFSLNQPLILNGLAVAQIFCSFLILSYCVAFVVSMLFELPMMELERALISN